MSGELETVKGEKLCPKCGKQVAPDTKFCGSCGTSLVTLCPNCGVEVAPDSQFCTACGAAMSQEAGRRRVTARILEFLENSGVENKHLLAGKHVTPAILKAVRLDCLEPDEKPLLLVKFKVGRLANASPGFWTKLLFSWVWGALLITDRRLIWTGLVANNFFSMLLAISHVGGRSGSIALDDIREACVCDSQYTLGGSYCGHPVAVNGEVLGLLALGVMGKAVDEVVAYLNELFAACFGG